MEDRNTSANHSLLFMSDFLSLFLLLLLNYLVQFLESSLLLLFPVFNFSLFHSLNEQEEGDDGERRG